MALAIKFWVLGDQTPHQGFGPDQGLRLQPLLDVFHIWFKGIRPGSLPYTRFGLVPTRLTAVPQGLQAAQADFQGPILGCQITLCLGRRVTRALFTTG
jgi:hypothetical protein